MTRKHLQYALLIAWIICLLGMSGALYFSEIVKAEPCVLCWYERIALFPLVFLLGMALIRDEFTVIPYAIGLSLFGLAVTTYHVLLQKLPWLQENAGTCGRVSCIEDPLNLWGWVTLALLGWVAFAIVTVILLWINKKRKDIFYR
ncbi:MAG: disulfide oxidoreductase [Bacilli bacterium]